VSAGPKKWTLFLHVVLLVIAANLIGYAGVRQGLVFFLRQNDLLLISTSFVINAKVCVHNYTPLTMME